MKHEPWERAERRQIGEAKAGSAVPSGDAARAASEERLARQLERFGDDWNAMAAWLVGRAAPAAEPEEPVAWLWKHDGGPSHVTCSPASPGREWQLVGPLVLVRAGAPGRAAPTEMDQLFTQLRMTNALLQAHVEQPHEGTAAFDNLLRLHLGLAGLLTEMVRRAPEVVRAASAGVGQPYRPQEVLAEQLTAIAEQHWNAGRFGAAATLRDAADALSLRAGDAPPDGGQP